MKRIPAVLCVMLILVSASACSTPKPPSTAATEGSKIVGALRDLSSMYEKKNRPGFMNLVSDDFKARKAFAASIDSVFSKYDAVQFTIQYTKLFITIEDKGMTRATFNWDSSWTKGGSTLRNSGRGTFVFGPKEAKLVAIDGKNPFVPQAIETPKQ